VAPKVCGLEFKYIAVEKVMIKHQFILAAFLFLWFSPVFSQTPVALTPVSSKSTHSSLEDDQPITEPTASATVLQQTPQPSVTPSGTPVAQGNFQSMSDLHKEALTPKTDFEKIDHSDPNYVPPQKPAAGAVTVFPPENDFFDRFHFQIAAGGGADFLGQNFNTTYRASGLGGHLAAGFLTDDHWSLWLSESYYYFPPADSSSFFGSTYYQLGEADFWETVFSFRYTLGGSFFKPYLSLGVGFLYVGYDGDVFTNGTTYTAAPLIQAGLGLQFPLNSDLSFFIEAKANFLFETIYNTPYYYESSGTSQVTAIEVPVNAGIVVNLFGDGKPTPIPTATPIPTENWFVKTGGGLLFNKFNSYGEDVEGSKTTDFLSTAAIGLDFPNHLSIFGSVEQFPGSWGILGNLQYTVPLKTHFWSPYVCGGVGVCFSNNPDNPPSNVCLQFGLGAEFRLTPEMALFTEGRIIAGNFDSSYDSAESNFAALTGLQFNLSRQSPKTSSLSATDSGGHPFLEIAGAVDTPAQNWQPAYTATNGEVFSAGYEFKDGLTLQLDVENFYFTGSGYVGSITDNVMRLLPTIRYQILPIGILRPYVLVGLGTEIEVSGSYYGNATVAYLDAAAGVGLDVSLGDRITLFAEGKYNWVFAYGVIGQDIPVLTGVRFGL
jgi:hypothetical protein